jgi:pimeloyl-ACP methyl ester carboxylesterase
MQLVETHAGDSPSVLFLHGGNVAGWMWQEQAADLPDHHSLIPDLPGFGASADQPWTSMADIADDLAELIRDRAAHSRAHVVGLSLGGILGTVLASRHPDVVLSTFVTGAAVRGVGPSPASPDSPSSGCGAGVATGPASPAPTGCPRTRSTGS